MLSKIDILFIHCNASDVIYQDLSSEHSAIEPPIWAAMLAKTCLSKGHNVELLDCEVAKLTTEESAKQIYDYGARLNCFVVYGQQPSASSQNMEGAVATATALKLIDSDKKTIFVGGHVAALPREVLALDCVDVVCQNEGVYSILDLLAARNCDLARILGIGYKSGGELILNPPSMIVPQAKMAIDLPGMAWDLLPSLDHYRTAGWHSWSNNSIKEPFGALYTSLGCPFKCSFCMINIINRVDQGDVVSSDSAKFRYWEPEHIIKEFDYLASVGVTNLKIADEMFVLKPRHFMAICDLLIERDYGFNIWAYARVDTCKPEYLAKLKAAGVTYLGLGIENPNQELRKEVVKGMFAEVSILDVLQNVRDVGIHIAANYIFGLPMDTEQSMQETLDFAIEQNTEMANFYCAMAYPGSPLYREASENNWELPGRYAGYSQHSYYTQNLPTRELTASQVLEFRDYAWDKYHTNDRYLDLLRTKFGQPAVDSIQAASKVTLKRKLLGH